MNLLIKEPVKILKMEKITLEKLRDIASEAGEPETRSGKQELYEQLINIYLA